MTNLKKSAKSVTKTQPFPEVLVFIEVPPCACLDFVTTFYRKINSGYKSIEAVNCRNKYISKYRYQLLLVIHIGNF